MTTTKSTTPYERGKLYQIPCSDLHANPNQPRKYFDKEALDDLADSINTYGVLQPILFREDQDGKLFVVSGERRLKASIIAKKETIPAILSDGNPEEVALIENIFRDDLSAIDHAEAVNRLMNEKGYTQEQVGIFLRKAKSTINDILQLVKLPQEIKDECRRNPKISRQVLIDIARKKKDKWMVTAYNKYKAAAAKKQAKEEAKKVSPPKPTVKRTFESSYASKFDKMKKFMTGINLGKLDDDKRKKLSSIIEDLKKAADDYLEIIKKAPTYVEKSKPVAKQKPKKEPAKKKVVKTDTKSKAKKS